MALLALRDSCRTIGFIGFADAGPEQFHQLGKLLRRIPAQKAAGGKSRRLAVGKQIARLARQLEAVVAAISENPRGRLQPHPLQQPARMQSGFCRQFVGRQRTGIGDRLEQTELVSDINHRGNRFRLPVLPDHVRVLPRGISSLARRVFLHVFGHDLLA